MLNRSLWPMRIGCVAVGVSVLLGIAQHLGLASAAETMSSRFVLVRPPDFADECPEGTEAPSRTSREAAVVFRPGARGQALRPGTKVFIVAGKEGTVTGTLTGLIRECTAVGNVRNAPIGRLRLETPVPWRSGDDAFVGITGQPPSPQQIGFVREVASAEAQDGYLKQIRPKLPAGHLGGIERLVEFAPPGGTQGYVLAVVWHSKPEESAQLGDKALHITGFVFAKATGAPRLLVAEPWLTGVLAITDLDKDGVSEVAVAHSAPYGGTYEIRQFDGISFSKAQTTLYRWAD